LQFKVRLGLVEQDLGALAHPDDKLQPLVPDLPDLGALAIVGAADVLGVVLDLVVEPVISIAGELLEALLRLAPGQVARCRDPLDLGPAAADGVQEVSPVLVVDADALGLPAPGVALVPAP